MKKKLALVLAAAMALTSLPTVAFGKSSNSISTVVSAKEDTKLRRITDGGTDEDDYYAPSYVPRLELISDSTIPIERGSIIRLHLTNAEWLNETDDKNVDYFAEKLLKPSDITTRVKSTVTPIPSLGLDPEDIKVRRVDATTVELQLGTKNSDTYEYDNPNVAPYDYTKAVISGGSGDGSAFTVTPETGITLVDETKSSTTGYSVLLQESAGFNSSTFADGVKAAEIDTTIDSYGAYTDYADANSNSINDGETVNFSISGGGNYFDIDFKNDPDAGDDTTQVNVELEISATEDLEDLIKALEGKDAEANDLKDIVETFTLTYYVVDDTSTSLIKEEVTIKVAPFTNKQITPEAKLSGICGNTIQGDTIISIPLLTELTGAGDAVVRIESVEGNVTTGPYTFANVSDADVKVTVSKTVTIPETGKELETIIINEVTPGSLKGEYYVRLKAPSNFYWSYTDDAELGFVGYYSDIPNIKLSSATLIKEGFNNSKTNEVTLRWAADKDSGLPASTSIGTITISGLILKVTDDAKFGDVNVSVRGGVFSNTSVLVGEYKDYVVTMEAADKDLPVILAGYMPGYASNSDVLNEEEVLALELHIAESVPNSWWGLRKTLLSVPDGVQIRGAEIKFTKGGSYEELVDEHDVKIDIESATNKGKFTEGEITIYKGERLEFKGLKMKEDEKAEAWVKLYLSVEPGFTGDIVATLSGGGIDEDITATIATAVNPVNVSMKQTEIKLGYKNIELNDITITETKAGAIRKEYYEAATTRTPDAANPSTVTGGTTKKTAKMYLQIGDTTDMEYLKFDSIGSYEVTEGDIVLDSVKVRSGRIEIEVKNESDKPSTIVLKGVTGLADRVPPEGYYALSIGGEAVINNYRDSKVVNGEFDTQYFEVPKAYNVITAAPGSANEFNTYVQMKIDDTTMIVGSDTIQMDAAPYISEGRTMLPIRYVANAFGISNDNIHFDQNSKTVTLVTQNRTVQLTVGSRTILSNGTPIEMDVAAEITDGRTFIPVMWVATALGIAQPVWDEATRTVTFNGEYASNDALGSQVQDNSGADAEVVSTDDADEDEE